MTSKTSSGFFYSFSFSNTAYAVVQAILLSLMSNYIQDLFFATSSTPSLVWAFLLSQKSHLNWCPRLYTFLNESFLTAARVIPLNTDFATVAWKTWRVWPPGCVCLHCLCYLPSLFPLFQSQACSWLPQHARHSCLETFTLALLSKYSFPRYLQG